MKKLIPVILICFSCGSEEITPRYELSNPEFENSYWDFISMSCIEFELPKSLVVDHKSMPENQLVQVKTNSWNAVTAYLNTDYLRCCSHHNASEVQFAHFRLWSVILLREQPKRSDNSFLAKDWQGLIEDYDLADMMGSTVGCR